MEEYETYGFKNQINESDLMNFIKHISYNKNIQKKKNRKNFHD